MVLVILLSSLAFSSFFQALKMCLDAAAIKAKHLLSYADAFAAVLTNSRKAVLITGDDEFESLTGETGFKVRYII